MSVSREELYRLIDALPVAELPAARRFLEYLRDTSGEEELSPEDIEAVRRGLEDIKAGPLWDSLHNYADDAATEEKREAARAVLADLQGELTRRWYTFAAGVVPTPPPMAKW